MAVAVMVCVLCLMLSAGCLILAATSVRRTRYYASLTLSDAIIAERARHTIGRDLPK